MAKPEPSLAPVEYPYSDGEPVESTQHYLVAHHVMGVFREHFGDSARYASNHGIYYKEGDPRKLVVPDVCWVANKPFEKKLVYLLWEEGKPPDFVLELASRTTLPHDEGKKRRLYAELGVADYFQFDPLGYLMTPLLKGYRLCDGAYRPLQPTVLPDGAIGIHSRALGLQLRALRGPGDPELRLFDPATNSLLSADSKRLREAERQRAELEHDNAELERANAELRARLAELERR